jgi:hypothetical protein
MEAEFPFACDTGPKSLLVTQPVLSDGRKYGGNNRVVSKQYREAELLNGGSCDMRTTATVKVDRQQAGTVVHLQQLNGCS